MEKDKMAHIRNLLVQKMEDLLQSANHAKLKLKIIMINMLIPSIRPQLSQEKILSLTVG